MTKEGKEKKNLFTEHLAELRDRLIHSFIAVMIGFIISYCFKEKLFAFLMGPLMTAMGPDNKMIFTGLPEAFFSYLKVALLSGIVLAIPILFYEFWMFVSPGLYKKEKKFLVFVVVLSMVFFLLGSSFGYFIVFPYGFKFFLGFSTETIHAMPSMKEYIGFASKMLLAFGLVFELPLVITFMAKMGLVTVDFLKKNRKYAILIFFTGAALITPPDVITQTMMAIPLIILYEISIIGAKIFGKEKKKEEEKKEKKDSKKKDKNKKP
ncbi:MAG: twin arginine-targeting protein translocase TatC [Desulfobacteraceae bacterium 4572_130]|nr:MAG: twin arginine-targeting protein translocase TatC [Desulfobacteraceae bacterium 4572_130]